MPNQKYPKIVVSKEVVAFGGKTKPKPNQTPPPQLHNKPNQPINQKIQNNKPTN